MKYVWSVLLAGALLLSSCTTAGGLQVNEGWARPAAAGDNAAVYFELDNQAAQADELTGVSTSVTDTVELHESMKGSEDMMSMSPLTSVPIEPRTKVTFEPGGYHVMLVSLDQPLTEGEQFDVILHFKQAGDVPLTVTVSLNGPNP